ncbi:DUF2180 family protein [Streptomyces sp. SID14478]|uniref:DUF2180 family protein n=1 Tax=Streptomyces sp. SID14478 TaxID=2706073 RepID=UPI0013DA7570|nr:DUF2180 family protein [Streptomyces sp. SID14478]NEB76370.1 DUF2180 family protein [Streptomyces sp. SID14478]
MNCYDCHQEGRATPATASCHTCGAGLCPDHIRVTAQDVHRHEGMGLSTLKQSARRLTCFTCHDAQHQL